jgi:hypothetical protein
MKLLRVNLKIIIFLEVALARHKSAAGCVCLRNTD